MRTADGSGDGYAMGGHTLAAMVPWMLVAFHTGSLVGDLLFGLLLLVWADDDWRRRIKGWAAGVPGRTKQRLRTLCPRPKGDCGLDVTDPDPGPSRPSSSRPGAR